MTHEISPGGETLPHTFSVDGGSCEIEQASRPAHMMLC